MRTAGGGMLAYRYLLVEGKMSSLKRYHRMYCVQNDAIKERNNKFDTGLIIS
jgi:hypothetical protein